MAVGRLQLALLLAAAGCGRIGFGSLDLSAGDANPGDTVDGGGPGIACGAASLLVDDFSGGQMSQARWGSAYQDVPGMLAQQGGRARITLQPNSTPVTYAAYATARTYDLTGSAVSIEIATVPTAAATAAEMMFLLIGPNGNEVDITISASATKMRVREPSLTTIALTAYNASAHRFQRFREQGGMIIGDVSGDGQTWTQFGSVAAPWDVRYTRISLTAGTYSSEGSPGIAEWEGVSVGVGTTSTVCPIDSAHGSFTDGTLAPEWFRRFGPAGCTESNGRLTLSLPAGVTMSCELASRRAFDLTGRAVVGEIPATTNSSLGLTSFGVAQDLSNNISIVETGGAMIFEIYADGVLVHRTPPGMRPAYFAALDRFWRIRHDASTSTLIAELGDLSGTYIELDRYTGPFPTGAVYLTFAADNNSDPLPKVAELLSINP